MMSGKFVLILLFIVPAVASATTYRGNLNLNYQTGESGGMTTSHFGQVLNFYVTDRIFYSNDLSLGAFLFHSKASNRERGDFRIRYTLNMTGYRYNFFSSYSPYTLYHQGGPSEKIRVFQASLGIKPKMLSDISASYTSTRQYSTDNPRTKSGLNYSWNVGTQFSKSFGSFRGIYQRQKARTDIAPARSQVVRTVNLGYDIAQRFPLDVGWSASYNFTRTENEIPGFQKDDSRTHIGAFTANRAFGRWFSASAATSGRSSDFERSSGDIEIDDFFSTASLSLRPRDNLTFSLLRGYSANRNRDDSVTEQTNDYVNFGGILDFPWGGQSSGRLSLSRSIYYESILGHNVIDNASLIMDMELYRQTSATLNLGLAHNEKSPSGQGRYQMTRNIDIISRPLQTMSLNANYQSSLASKNINFVSSNNDNLSLNVSHAPKPYFNYSATYTRSVFTAVGDNVISAVSLAANFRLARNLSLLSTYTRRDLGAGDLLSGEADETVTERVSWGLTRRSNLTVNYAVANINSPGQSQNLGGNFTWNF